MAEFFQRLSIRGKLVALVMVASVSAVLLMAALAMANEVLEASRRAEEQLTTLARVIGSRSTGALTFDDRATARENLDALRVTSEVVYAAILDREGEIFAQYGDGAAAGNLGAGSLLPGSLEIRQGIELEGERIGDIQIVASLAGVYARLGGYLLLLLGIVLACTAVAFALGSRMQRVVSAPILNLRQAMQRVSEARDYSVRVQERRHDELGVLVDGFNHMLAQIQLRDAELARYSSGLEQQVAERTAELYEANRKRLHWLEMVARFLRHELKNATVGMKTSIDLIERRSGNPALAVYVERARKSMLFMNDLLDSVGNATTLEAAFHKEHRQPLDLQALVEGRLQDYQGLYPVAMVLDGVEEPLWIRGNEVRLVQMLDKLVANAVEHCSAGSTVRLVLAREGDRARLSVIDVGDALPEDKEGIFELFVSMRGANRKRDDNYGLGLYIVRLIVESHGGQVEARDLAGDTGAEFLVTLPLTSPAKPKAAKSQAEANAR